MANWGGVNGFRERPEAIYRTTPAELKQRGTNGGRAAGAKRHAESRAKAVEAALKRLTAVIPDEARPVLSALYSEAHDAGYGSGYNRGRYHARRDEPAA